MKLIDMAAIPVVDGSAHTSWRIVYGTINKTRNKQNTDVGNELGYGYSKNESNRPGAIPVVDGSSHIMTYCLLWKHNFIPGDRKIMLQMNNRKISST